MKKILFSLALCLVALSSCNGAPERVKRAEAERALQDTCSVNKTEMCKQDVSEEQANPYTDNSDEDATIALLIATAACM